MSYDPTDISCDFSWGEFAGDHHTCLLDRYADIETFLPHDGPHICGGCGAVYEPTDP